MKNIHEIPRTLICALLVLLSQQVFAQSWTPASPVTACPGETGSYVLSTIPANYRFTNGIPPFVSGGRLLNFPAINNGSATFQVQWDDAPTGGRLTVDFEQGTRDSQGNTNWTRVSPVQTLVARIRSVASLTGPGGTLAVPYCSTSALTLTVPPQPFPNVPDEAVPAYLWEVPDSWGVQGATLIPSFVTTPGNFRLYEGTGAITLTPTPGGDVSLRVFPYSRACNQTYSNVYPLYRLLGFPGFLQIRHTPTASISTAPFTVRCGDRTPRTLTATGSQAGSPSFDWTLPSGWTIQGPANGASIQAVPSGSNGGDVYVRATYSCGSVATTTAPAGPVAVGFDRNQTPVYISPGVANQLYCGSSSLTMAATSTNGTYFEWSADHGATVTPAVTTTSGAQVFVSGGWDGPINVTVRASNPAFNCTPSNDMVTVYHNRGAITEATNPLQLLVAPITGDAFFAPNGSVNCGRPLQLEISGNDLYGNLLPASFRWIVDGQDYTAGTTLNTVLRQSQVTVVVVNACGYEDYYYWTVPVNGTCVAGGGGGGGGGPIDPPPYDPGRMAYPNPAGDEVSVEQTGGSVRLYNAYGQPVRILTAQPGRLRLDTSRLPAGLYFLETTDAKGRPARQQVRIAH